MLDDTKHDSDARLVLNVAITRTKNRFYFVGHTKHLLSDLHRDSVLARIIHYLYEEAEILDSGTFVDKYFTTDFEKWADTLLSTTAITQRPVSGDRFTERNFWAQFFQDLKTVNERLIILSPFLTVQRSSKFMDYFKAMIGKSIDIRVYTRPSNLHTGEMQNQAKIVIEQLRGIGATVIERRMHQKIAIMDNAILWEGSLNILSRQDAGEHIEEHMRRFEGQSAIEDIIKNLELDEDMPVGSQTEEKCPIDGCNGFLVVRKKFGRKFFGCSNYPRCKYTRPI